MERKAFLKLLAGSGFASALPTVHSFSSKSTEHIIKPPALKRGDTIGLISPASIVGTNEEYDEAAEQITQLGYKIKEGSHARSKYGYFAGTDRQRADDLNAMFADPDIDAIMAFRGGWGSNRILEYIDYELIANHPKVFVGYSDITALLLAIYHNTGLTTFHGPVAKSKWTGFTTNYFKKAVGFPGPFSVHTHSNSLSKSQHSLTPLHPGTASGRLLGGNLSIVTSMIGSPYLPEWEGCILFLEDVGEDVYRIDRMLSQLKLSGVLDRISGFIFGQCTSCDVSEPDGFTLLQILKQYIKPLEIPAFLGTHIGHIDDMFTLPVGAPVTISAESGSIQVMESITRISHK